MKYFANAKFPQDLFIVINSATNFILYMALSKTFRNDSKEILGKLFGCCGGLTLVQTGAEIKHRNDDNVNTVEMHRTDATDTTQITSA